MNLHSTLYVKESPVVSLRNFYPRRGDNAASTTPITNEIGAFGQQLGINAQRQLFLPAHRLTNFVTESAAAASRKLLPSSGAAGWWRRWRGN
jgi:hypothetical protein